MMKLMHSRNYVMLGDTCEHAAISGNIDVLKWSLDNGGERVSYVMRTAVLYGHINLIQWLIDNKFPYDSNTFRNAIFVGNLGLLEILIKNSCDYDIRVKAQLEENDNQQYIFDWICANLDMAKCGY